MNSVNFDEVDTADADHVLRLPRLLDRLDARAVLTRLCAPAGFGKTTLVEEWLRTADVAGETVVWLTASQPITDAGAFWRELLSALAQAGVAVPDADADLSPRAAASMAISAHGRVLLILDSFEQVRPEGIDHALVDLAEGGTGLRLIVCTRSDQQFVLGAGGQSLVLDAARMAWTEQEAAVAFAEWDVTLSVIDMGEAHAYFAGWPALIHSFARSEQANPHAGELRPAIRKVAQRFATDVLVGENADQGRFVQSVCVEADLTLETARLLSDDPDPQPALDRMGADGLLRRQEQDGESRYSWLPVARRLIRDAVGARRPQSLAALDLRLVHWYRESGRPDRALSHAAGTGDWPLVVRIIESAWRPLLFEHNDLLLHVITMVPYEAFRGSVAAAAAREVLLRVPADIATGSDADTEGTTARSRRELLAMGASPNVQRILDAELMSMVVARRRGLFARARRTSDEIAVIADAAGACRTAEVSGLLPLVYLQSGLTRLLARDTEGATTHLSEAFRLGPEGDHAFVEREAAGKLALVFALTGDIKRAQRWTMRLEDDVPLAPWLRPLVRNSGDLAQALVAIDRLAPESAIAALDRINDTIYNDELWAYGVYVQARYALLWGDPMAALAVLRRERERHADWHTLDSDALPMLAATEVNLLIAMGQGSYVRAVLTAAGRAHPELLLAWARFDLLTGDPDRALASVLNVIFAEPTSQRLRTEAQLLQAVARHRLGDIETAREVFRRVVRNIKDQDALAYFSMVPREDLFSLAEDVRDTAALIGGSSGRGVPVVFPASLDVVRLTEREQVVLERLAEYRSAPEIATSLYVSVHTVKSQVGSLYRKLGVNSRDHAVLAAREMGLLR